MIKKGGLFILFICLSILLKAQKFSFLKYSTKEGLAQSQIYDIKQDSKQYLWIATLGGLSKFNGKSFQNYQETEGLLSNKINSIFIDSEDNVWVVSNSGISIVQGDSIILFEHNELFGDYELLEVVHHQNKIWVGAENGIYCFQKTNSLTRPKLIGEYKKEFNELMIDDISIINSTLYVATNRGFFSIKDNKVIKQPFLEEENISTISENSKGEIWVSTLENGVFQISGQTVISINQENTSLPNNYLTSLLVDRNDKVWLCSNSGLTEISKNLKIQNYTEVNGFDYEPIITFEDIEGNIWIGTNGGGLIKFANKEFLYLTKDKELHSDKIISIGEDVQGNIWLGSFGEGVAMFNSTMKISYDVIGSSLPNNNIWALLKDSKDKLWLGTSEGLCCYKDNKFITFTEEDGLPSDKVQSLFQEVPEVLWIGTRGGVAFYKDKKFNVVDSFPYTNVRAIASSRDGRYWFGTSQGLVSYDGFKAELIQDSLLLDNTVYSVATYENKLWIGTRKGLVYFDGISYSQYSFSPDNYQAGINFVFIDRSNFLWIGTNRGVFTLDINAHNEGKKVIEAYTTNNGLIGMETNLNSIFEDSKGNIWFGTSEGINVYKREKEQLNNYFKPSIYITNVKLFFGEEDYLTSLRDKSPIKFGFKQNMVTFNYHTNYFKDPSAVKYSYKLKGLDEEWSPMEPTSSTRYPNLSHGEYTFMVKSSVDGKEWSNVDEVSFVIKAPYWLTWWFRTTILLVLSFIVYFLINRRRKAIKKEREVELLNYKNKLIKLEQQSLNASMNRHFIFNSLNSIQFYINKEDKLSANRYLSNFSKLIRRNLDSSSAEDNLIPLSEEIERLTLYLSLENMRFKEKFSYEINMDPEVDAEMTKVPAMFMQPFIENSIWHGILPMENPGKIDIDIYKEGDRTIFEITDNGIGINTSIKKKSQEQNEHSSKGMKIATNRIELLQKVIQKEITIDGPKEIIENDKIMGTKVIIVFG